jgi:hypothetical protein
MDGDQRLWISFPSVFFALFSIVFIIWLVVLICFAVIFVGILLSCFMQELFLQSSVQV